MVAHRINKRNIWKGVFQWSVTAVIGLVILFPLYWIFISSITPQADLFSTPIDYFPDNVTLENYVTLFTSLNILGKALNTIIITAIALVASTISCTLAAYAFARYSNKLINTLFTILMFSAMLPGVVTARALYDYMRSINLIDTYLGLAIIYTSNLITFSVIVLRSYLERVPLSIEESAEIDGANFMQKFFYVVLPLMRPGIATMCIINFINCLNDLFTPLYFGLRLETLSVGITTLPRTTQYSTPWNYVSTMGWFIVFPIILFVLLFEDKIMDGIMAGGVKQ